ncbi:hypothetical protein [Flavobacterium sangjuense]|uniref:Uncharacterized protein n=1 Tax=Flavobacterium sangjuense TaxID=2518177 RepID=A0A4P7PWD3_9FLAO|nr:hypothetical protein [Flavobacterium sangjuense]QBZ98622.1 hypothetical protein GS03_02131 [Flavobacterium sangjuense]
MERNNWIENILNSTNGLTPVTPSDDLFSKIQQRIQLESKVSSKTVWLVAASIAVLVMLNFSVIAFKSKEKTSSTTAYLEMTVNKSNQLY